MNKDEEPQLTGVCEDPWCGEEIQRLRDYIDTECVTKQQVREALYDDALIILCDIKAGEGQDRLIYKYFKTRLGL